MFVYWGAICSGKCEAYAHAYFNESPISTLYADHIGVNTNIKCDDTDVNWKWEYKSKHYGKKDSFKYEILDEVKRYKSYEDRYRNNYGTEYHPQIERSRRVTVKRAKKQKRFSEYTGTYKLPFSLKSIGLDKTNIIPQSLHWRTEESNKSIIRQIKSFNHINIIPYRVIDNFESVIHKIQMWCPDFCNFEYEDVFDCYTKNKDLVFDYLATFYREQRNIEVLLQEHGLNYEYYDMDTYDLASITGLPRNYTHPDGAESYRLWNLDDPDTKKRFDMAVDICEEFLKVTGLTDTRLEFRAKDGI